MKKFYFLLLSFLALSLCANAAEQTVTFDFSDPTVYGFEKPAPNGGTNLSVGDKIVSGDITIELTAESSSTTSNRFYNSSGKITLRTYNGKDGSKPSFTFSTSNGTLKSISYYTSATATATSVASALSESSYVWNPAKLTIAKIDVVYDVPVAGEIAEPVIAAANAADLGSDYSTLGEGTGAITFTTTTEEAKIYYSTTAEDATDFEAGTTFEGFKASSATDEGVKTIWAYAEKDGVKSTVASASYTFAQPQVATPGVTLDGTPEAGSDYLVGQTVKVTATCEEGAKLVYSYTNGDDYVELPAEGVNVTSEEVATINIYVKAIKENYKDSRYVKNSVNFVNPPKSVKFEQVTDALQLVAGAKYVITNANDTKIMLGYESGNNCKSEDVEVSSNTLQIMDNFSGILTLGVTDGQTGYYYYLQQADGKYLNQGETGSNRLKAVVNLQDYSYWTIEITESGEAQIKNVKNTSKGVMQYNGTSGTSVFNCYESYNSNTGYERLHLYRMVEETTVGLKEVLDGNVGCKYHINCALRVNYKDDNYVYASTIGGGSTATAPTAAQAKEYWSDKVENFRQNDWVAIADLDETYVGKEIEAGSVATYVENNGFPVIKFDSMNAKEGTKVETNTYRVANFNIGSTSPVVNKLWLVSPQPAEYCKVKGYVDVADVKASYLFAQTGSEATVIEGTSYDPLNMRVNLADASTIITTSGWYVFEGVVVKGSTSLQLNAISAEDVSTGVEGVETSSVKVYGAEGVINVVSEEVAPIAVYSANGAIVSSVEASSASIAVAPGFYIVKAGNSVSKVTVK